MGNFRIFLCFPALFTYPLFSFLSTVFCHLDVFFTLMSCLKQNLGLIIKNKPS